MLLTVFVLNAFRPKKQSLPAEMLWWKPTWLSATFQHFSVSLFVPRMPQMASLFSTLHFIRLFLTRYLTGMVDKRTLEKYEREAKEKNRETWWESLVDGTLIIIIWTAEVSIFPFWFYFDFQLGPRLFRPHHKYHICDTLIYLWHQTFKLP